MVSKKQLDKLLNKKILLFGKNGQVGFEVCSFLEPLCNLLPLGREDLNLENVNEIESLVEHFKPDYIINCAAFTGVDAAEIDERQAYLLNCKVPQVMAEVAQSKNAFLIHLSTDYVFDGANSGPYSELDKTNPLNVYGKTKLLGEAAIQKKCCKHIILRTSWVFSPRGKNFVKAIIQKSKTKKTMEVVNDQVGIPTSAKFLANVIVKILACSNKTGSLDHQDKVRLGIYHAAMEGKTTWYALANDILNYIAKNHSQFPMITEKLVPISSSGLSSKVIRPPNSVLSNKKLISEFDVTSYHWKTDLNFVIDKLVGLTND